MAIANGTCVSFCNQLKAHYLGRKTPCWIYTKFCTTGDILDVITDANFGVDRLRGFNVARG